MEEIRNIKEIVETMVWAPILAFTILTWIVQRKMRGEAKAAKAALDAHRAAHTGWRTVVVGHGGQILFTEDLTVEEAQNLLNYDMASVQIEDRTITYDLMIDTGFVWRKAPQPKA